MAAAKYVSFFTFAAVLIVSVAANDECTYTKDTQTACTVDRGHAVCESIDLDASVRGIPECATWITLSLQKLDSYIYPNWESIFAFLRSLPWLEKLSITVQQEKYKKIHMAWLEGGWVTTNFPKLKILQINIHVIIVSNWTTSLPSLQVLDFTRSLVGIASAKRFCKTLQAVQKLILRNIQSLTYDTNYIPSVNLTDFVCIGNVRYLDLSCNDLITISFANMCWDTKLQVLILDHNKIAHVEGDEGIPPMLTLLQAIPRLITLSVNYFSSKTFYPHRGLWDDDDNRTDIGSLVKDDDKNMSIINEVITNTPLSLLAGYQNWLQDVMMKHCGNIDYLQIAKCIEYDDVCAFLSCVAPEFNTKVCKNDSSLAYAIFSRQFCDFFGCKYNIMLPLPRSLTKISMREYGLYADESKRPISPPHPNETSLCFDPSNSLEILDLLDAKIDKIYPSFVQYAIHGLKKLKFLSVQGCRISYVINPLFFSDMGSVKEVHIGENRLLHNDSLPAVMFQQNVKLTVLNLSYSHLQVIESNAFTNNKHLAVLDLSHNRLDASSLAALDLSNNNITHLNLSYNALVTLPATLRHHIDQFHDLVLDLSGNNFLCNCQHLDFLQWIQNNTAISLVNAGDHVCSDSPGNTIHNIEVDSLYCNWYWEQPTIAVGCSLLLFLFFLTIFIIYRKRWFIRNLIFRLQERFSHNSADDTDVQTYKYDTFVLYSSVDADRLWVHYKLVPELEKVYGFRLCIHHRNFPAGFDIVDNIAAAIRSSRKVLVIMSKKFVESGWCVEEVKMTRSIDRNKLIVIMYSDVSAVRLPPVIELLLETRTYIEWEENAQAQELFWKKVRKALYTKTKLQEQPANAESDSRAINLLPTGDILAWYSAYK